MEPTQSQPKSHWLIVTLSVVGIILLVTTVFLYLQNQKLQKKVIDQQVVSTIQTPSSTPETESTTTVPPDKMAGWKTYASPSQDNSLARVSMKYPINWRLNEVRFGNPYAPGYGFILEDENSLGNINMISMNPVIFTSTGEYIEKTKGYLVDYKETAFLERSAVIGLYSWSKQAEQLEEIFFVEGLQGYVIQIRYKDSHKTIDSLPKLDPDILQTFKFAD